MNLRPRTSSSRRAPALLAVSLVLTVLTVLAGPAAAVKYTPQPASGATIVPVGGKAYVQLGIKPVIIPLLGPGTLTGYARVSFEPGEEGPKPGSIEFAGVTDRTISIPLNFTPSTKSTWDDGRAGVPSGGRKFEIYIPAGVHDVTVSGLVPGGGFMAATFRYDGPGQNQIEAARKSGASNPWSYRNTFGVEVIFDDNVITQGDEGIDTWIDGTSPEQFRIRAIEDLLVAPWLDFSATRKFISWGKTKLRFKIKRWMYTQNPIKTNTDLNWYIRQYWGSKKSLELFYHYAPEQFIRMLTDRPPYGDDDAPSEYKEFRFTRNVAYAMWRQTVSRKFSYSLQFEFNGRYYNKPFIENDIEAWEIRGRVSYRVHKRFKVDLDYSYEDATARGVDTVDEDRETSDDGDASYRRDLYRFGFTWTTRWAMPLFGSITGSYLFMDYYYPTQKPLFSDPYHTGRRDMVTKVTVQLNRRINRRVSVYGSFRYSERIVESPWYGDITLDKDYVQHRYWVGMTYKF